MILNRNVNLHSIFFSFCEIENFAVLCKLVNEYGEFVRVWLGPQLNILISDPKDVEVNFGMTKKKTTQKSKPKQNICCAVLFTLITKFLRLTYLVIVVFFVSILNLISAQFLCDIKNKPQVTKAVSHSTSLNLA